MKYIVGFLLLFNQVFSQTSSFVKLSDEAEFGLITCAPGDELYSIFGHSALHLYDPVMGLSTVYNYGMFSFNTDNFYYKFVKGETDYKLGKQGYSRFVREYDWYQRNSYEHKLNLSQEEKQALFEAMETNYMPENRYYRYSYLLDNCSSRLRDMLQTVLGEKLDWNGVLQDSIIPDGYPMYDILQGFYSGEYIITYRDILDMYLVRSPWSDFGIDLAIGAPIDKPADINGSMFIPDFLMTAVCHSQVATDSVSKPLVESVDLITSYYEQSPINLSPKITDPVYILWFVSFIVLFITVLEIYFKRSFYWFDSILFGIFGLFAIVIWFVTYISVHPAVFPNYITIWLLPTHLFVAILIYIKSLRKYLDYYFILTVVITLIFFILWPFLPQRMNLANIPLILIPFIRSIKYSIVPRIM